MMISLILMLSFQDPAPATASDTLTPEAPTPRVAAFREPLVGYSEQGDALGHTGNVVVEATVGLDGRFSDATIIETSRSELLDAEALAMLGEARVGRNPPEPVRARVTVQFRPTEMLTMDCEEFARQVRWYESAWPERTHRDMIIYTMQLGLEWVIRPQTGDIARALTETTRKFPVAFTRTLERCEREPGERYMPIFQQELRRVR